MKNQTTPRTNPLLLSILLIVGLMLTSAAIAGEIKSDDFDANGDGQITFPEVMQKLEKSARTTFDAMDHNKDGVLSDKDFDDVREGMQKLEDWLHDLLKPFIRDDDSGPMAV